jgi:hypothetical protein
MCSKCADAVRFGMAASGATEPEVREALWELTPFPIAPPDPIDFALRLLPGAEETHV